MRDNLWNSRHKDNEEFGDMARGRRIESMIRPRRPLSRLISIRSLFIQTASEWYRDNALRLSAAVSFYAVLSLAPLLAIVIRVMGIAHARQFARVEIMKQATNLMGIQAADAIKPIIESNAAQSVGSLAAAVSTVVLLFSATSVFIELQDSMNSIWGVEIKAHKATRAEHAVLAIVRARLLSLAMVFGLGFLLIFSIFGTLTALQSRIAGVNHWPAYLADVAISLAVEFSLFAAIFKFLPQVQPRWKDVWIGALIAAILFSAGRFGLAIYFEYARSENVYGAAGSLVAVLTWIYYSSFSLYFGAEFTKVWARRHDPRHSTPR
jgi:membrane protein